MNKFILTTTLTLVTSLYASAAVAQPEEVRFGGGWHSFPLNVGGGKKDKESSPSINAEVIFTGPKFLHWALKPDVYLGGTVNLGGETSHGGGGLFWRQHFGSKGFFKHVYGDFSTGLVVHDGHLQFKEPTDVADLPEYNENIANNIEYGSRVLFRQNLSLGYRVTEKWAGEVFLEHLSNGRILSSRENEGVNTLGLKAAYRFKN